MRGDELQLPAAGGVLLEHLSESHHTCTVMHMSAQSCI